MKLFTYDGGSELGVGVVVDATSFVALRDAAPELPPTLRGLLELGDGLARAKAAASSAATKRPLTGVRFASPIPEPNAIWCLALNFQNHIDETGLTTSADFPHIFLRQHASIVGNGEPLHCPPPEVTQNFDYEGELGVVIGKPGRNIRKEEALQYVAGYTCVNEGSVREFQRHNRNFGLGKNFEQSGSIGPYVVTPDEFGNPKDHQIVTRLNGEERQHQPLADMIFSVEDVIAYLSRGYRLRPGDIIAMGTPGALPPGKKAMHPGDVVEVEINGAAILRNPIVAAE